VTGFRVYTRAASQSFGAPVYAGMPVAVAGVYSVELPVSDVAKTYVTATAYNSAGESARSNEQFFAASVCDAAVGDACIADSVASPLAPQRSAQQTCINEMNWRGSGLAKEQGRLDLTCLTDAGNGKVERLGNPPQAQTAQACLTNDVKRKLVARVTQLETKEDQKCLALPAQLPDFANAGGSVTAAATQNASLDLTADLFGPQLDAAVASYLANKSAAVCQREVQKRAQAVFDQLWSMARTSMRTKLRGSRAIPAAANADELQNAIESSLTADARQVLARTTTALAQKAADACTGQSLRTLFPGACAASPDPGALAACATGSARCRFCQSLNASDAMTLDCDVFDDGAADGSCP
jgi:hypothetical protein